MEEWNENIKLFPQDRLFALFLEPLIPRIIRPNHLTVLRFIFTPVVLYFLWQANYGVGVPLFFLAALTDALDGSLARTRREITAWGILYDPLADKLLIGSVLVLIVWESINHYLGIGLLLVEAILIIGGAFRRFRGVVVQADVWGKTKMVAEVIGILLLLFALWFRINLLVDLSTGTLALALVAAIVSIFTKMR